MFYRNKAIAAVLLSLAGTLPYGFARADDMPVKAAKPVADAPFFFIIDDRVTYSYTFQGTDPGLYTVNPNGSINGKTAKQLVSFTHFDVWAYGTNFFTIDMLKSGHNDPAAPCAGPGTLLSGAAANCAGATEIYGLIRSTFGWNEIFDTKAFSVGPLRNISFEVGADAGTENSFVAYSKRDFVAGLQFAFDLPYKGFFNISPMVYKEMSHSAFTQCGLFGPGVPGVTCIADGNTVFPWTWDLEVNYYMDLGFLPQSMQFFSISGRAAWHGPKGNSNSPLVNTGTGINSTQTKVEFNSEPIRLTFDASKAAWGAKYSHNVDIWVSYLYWQNKFGLDHNAAPGICTIAGTGQSTNSCTESSLHTGITVKF
jgi:hypothetical protein